MAESKLVKVEANLKAAQVELDKKESGPLTLWGIQFACAKGKATAEIDPDIAKAMKDAGLVK